MIDLRRKCKKNEGIANIVGGFSAAEFFEVVRQNRIQGQLQSYFKGKERMQKPTLAGIGFCD